MKKKTLEEKIQFINQPAPIERLEKESVTENGFLVYKSKINQEIL